MTADAKEFPPYINPDDVLAAVIDLFARVPGLPQQLLERAKREVIADKTAPFFDYLFEGTSRPAVGANYNIIGYRLREVNEGNFVNRAEDRNLADINGITH